MKYCFKCGSQLDDNAVFCVNCGQRIEGEATPAQQQNYGAQPNPYAQQQNYGAQPNPYAQQQNYGAQPNLYAQQQNYGAQPNPYAQQNYTAEHNPYAQPNYAADPNSYAQQNYTAEPTLYTQPYGAEQAPQEPVQPSGLSKAAKILMIISTIILACSSCGIALAWCLPMTISYSRKIRAGLPVSTGFKVWTLLIVNTLAGIFMLCDRNN